MDNPPFKLVVQPRIEGGDNQAFERSFTQDAVTIGRASTSDVVLQDPRRIVSARHAEIRSIQQKFVLIDLSSANGTTLNEQRLVPGTEYALHQGDQFRIGDFMLQFYCLGLSDPDTRGAEPVEMPTCVIDGGEQFQHLAQQLRQIYVEHLSEGTERRQERMVETLRKAIGGLESADVEHLLESLEVQFPDPEYQQTHSVDRGRAQASRALPTHTDEAGRIAYEGIVKIASRYLANVESPIDPPLLEKIIQQIDRILEVMVNSLLDAVKGRRQFEREFEVEATRILAWTPNPIKSCQRGQDLGQYLLDMRRKDSDGKKVIEELTDVFRDLALHQVGMAAGFRECLRGLLLQLDPPVIEAEARAELHLPGRISFLIAWAAWRRFKEKHRRLTEEEVKVFEHILAPDFAKGYLSVQKAKGRS